MRTCVGRAPGRVNLIGEHTDYNEGLCLPIAIPYATTVTATARDDEQVTLRSRQQAERWEGTLDQAGPGQVTGWATYAVGVLWALREAGWELPGVDLEVDSSVPMGAGLSSSAALEGAVAVAMCGLLDRRLTTQLRQSLVEVCRRAESEVAGAPTGGMDQTVSLLAAADAALLIDFEDHSTRVVPLPLEAASLQLLIIDTRVSHALTDGGYAARRSDCESAADLLGLRSLRRAQLKDVESLQEPRLRARARHVVMENQRVDDSLAALATGDWAAFGRLMNGSHTSLRDDFEVSCAELDLAVETSHRAGALGARMTGGGFGGSAIALVPRQHAEGVRRSIDAAFAAAGFTPPQHLEATACGPAGWFPHLR